MAVATYGMKEERIPRMAVERETEDKRLGGGDSRDKKMKCYGSESFGLD